MRTRKIDASGNCPKRTPVHEQKDKLNVIQDPDFHYRWVNSNDPNRVEKFKEAGYEVVSNAGQVGDSVADSQVSQTTGVTERYMGGGMKAVLMRIRKDWFEEDQELKQENLKEAEAQMIREAKHDRYGNFEVERRK